MNVKPMRHHRCDAVAFFSVLAALFVFTALLFVESASAVMASPATAKVPGTVLLAAAPEGVAP